MANNLKLDSAGLAPAAQRHLPEASTSGTISFSDVEHTLRSAAGVAGDAARIAGDTFMGGLLSAVRGGTEVSQFQDLLNAQMQVQMEMQAVSMQSNVEKSKHETRMAPIRNIRVS